MTSIISMTILISVTYVTSVISVTSITSVTFLTFDLSEIGARFRIQLERGILLHRCNIHPHR
mgnify:CR=1 FL=1